MQWLFFAAFVGLFLAFCLVRMLLLKKYLLEGKGCATMPHLFGDKLMKMLVFAISKLLSFPSWCLLSALAPAYFWLQRGHSASWPVLVCGLCSDSHLCCFPGAVIGPSVRLLLALMCFQTRALERTSTWKCSMSVSLTVCILILVCTCLFSRDLLCRLGQPWACLLLLKGKWSRPQTSYETELIRYEKWFSVSG